MKIEIKNAVIKSDSGQVMNATITGDATMQPPTTPPGSGDTHPSHPILLPPTSDNPDVFFLLSFCPNPPPPHWEWIAFTPGEPVDRPEPQPPPTDPPTTPSEPKPPPANGGWGWYPPYGWVYYPGPGGAGPKR